MKSPLKLKINKSIVVDQVAQFLIATKQVPFNCEIVDIDFTLIKDKFELTIHTKPEELEVIYFDLDNHEPSKSR